MLRAILNKLFWGLIRHVMSDEQYAKARYWLNTGKRLNLASPQTFSEKIQYLKLYDRIDIRQKVADRIRVRDFVAERAGSEYLIPLAGCYERMDQAVWESLPSRFVLKANHGSGMIKIVKDKHLEDLNEIINLTEKWKKTDYAKFGREWVYRDVPRTIVIEELLVTSENTIPEDFKFFCFHGKVQAIQIDFGRFDNQQRNLYDRNFMPLDMTLLYENYTGKVERPVNLDQAMELAETLSSGFSFMRVDLYLFDDKIYFGEMTNFPGNGFEPFTPDHYDLHFGSLLRLDL